MSTNFKSLQLIGRHFHKLFDVSQFLRESSNDSSLNDNKITLIMRTLETNYIYSASKFSFSNEARTGNSFIIMNIFSKNIFESFD